jgi:hypothetical protein
MPPDPVPGLVPPGGLVEFVPPPVGGDVPIGGTARPVPGYGVDWPPGPGRVSDGVGE